MPSTVTMRDIYTKYDQLKSYIDAAEQELQAKAREYNITGTNMLDIINQLTL